MFRPSVGARVVESRNLTRFWIDSADIRTFVAIATAATEREILNIRTASVLARNYVVNLETKPSSGLGEQAILAMMSGAGANGFIDPFVHRIRSTDIFLVPLELAPKRPLGLQPENTQQAVDVKESVQFIFFIGRERAVPRLG